MSLERCVAWHDRHDCQQPGACRTALLALCARANARDQQQHNEHRPDRLRIAR